MGICIYSKHKSNNLGYGGFYQLRKTIASLCPEEIRKHYMRLADGYYSVAAEDPGFVEYDKETEKLYVKYKAKYGKVIDFLYAPDTDAVLTYGTAKDLLRIIGEYDDDIIYGYAGWGDKAMRFRDFKEILQDACENKAKWGWR